MVNTLPRSRLAGPALETHRLGLEKSTCPGVTASRGLKSKTLGAKPHPRSLGSDPCPGRQVAHRPWLPARATSRCTCCFHEPCKPGRSTAHLQPPGRPWPRAASLLQSQPVLARERGLFYLGTVLLRGRAVSDGTRTHPAHLVGADQPLPGCPLVLPVGATLSQPWVLPAVKAPA